MKLHVDWLTDGLLVRTTRFRSSFFFLGQVLPTHRLAYSPHGGLFQPTMTQCIRLLCRPPFDDGHEHPNATRPDPSPTSPDLTDPFSTSQLTYTYTTNGTDTFPAPSAYRSRRHSWIHVFPEGKIHQHPERAMRYFKWGIARLILEAEPLPQIVPIWIDGFDGVMAEDRAFPRWMPRLRQHVRVVFGPEVDGEQVFGDLRRRWQALKRKEEEESLLASRGGSPVTPSSSPSQAPASNQPTRRLPVGILAEPLKHSQDAIELRIECTDRMRREVLKLRGQAGYGDEDPKANLTETWKAEGPTREGKMKDGSWVGRGRV